MEQEIYRVGDRVYHWRYGWGEVINIIVESITDYPVIIKFNYNKVRFTHGGMLNIGEPTSLSFTEYDLVNGGFSQVRPLPKIEVDTVVYVRSGIYEQWEIRYFSHFDSDGKINCFSNQKNSTQTISINSWEQYSLTNPLINSTK